MYKTTTRVVKEVAEDTPTELVNGMLDQFYYDGDNREGGAIPTQLREERTMFYRGKQFRIVVEVEELSDWQWGYIKPKDLVTP